MNPIPNIIKTSRGRLATYGYGKETSPIQLVFLHGGPGLDSTYLIENLAEPLQDVCRLLFVDLKGDGRSDKFLPNEKYALADYAADMAALLQAPDLTNHGKTILYGHSFGGFVAIKAASQFPHLFSGVILSNTKAHLGYVSDFAPIMKKLGISDEVDRLEEKLAAGEGTDADFREMMILYAKLYYPEFPQSEAENHINTGIFTARSYVNFLTNIVPKMNLTQDCQTIKHPVLILGSELDHITPWAAQEDLKSFIPNASCLFFPGAGHFPFVLKREEYVAGIKAWLSNL